MTPPGLLFAAAALLPAMTAPIDGTPRVAGGPSLLVALCNGGSLTLPLGSGAPPPGSAPCCAKGCRTGEKRRRIDPKQ